MDINELVYKLMCEMSETAIELAKVHLEDKRKFSDMRMYVLSKLHQQKRRARTGLEDKTIPDKFIFLKGCLDENRYYLGKIWRTFFDEQFKEAMDLIDATFELQVKKLEENYKGENRNGKKSNKD
jgi:hypothetical protein